MPNEGSLIQAGDRWQLRFERRPAHPPEKLWRALTEAEHLSVWFPAAMEGDREAGAKLRFVFTNDEGPPTDGEMAGQEPPRSNKVHWQDLHDMYVGRFGPEASTIGPPEGMGYEDC